MKANLKTFTTSNRWWSFMWGNGHTPETLPTKQGWRAARLRKGSTTLLVGKPGTPGCFSAVYMSRRYRGEENIIDVALYTETPEEVRDHLLKKDGATYCDCSYRQLPDISGWGLEALRLLREELEMLKQYS